MRGVTAAVICLAALASSVDATNPIQKVVELLSGLEAKIVKEGEEAQKVFTEFSEWCEERSANLKYEIKTGKAEVEDLSAAIAHEKASIEALSAKIEEITGALTVDAADLKAATEIRNKEAADFAVSEAELMSAVDALERAIGILEREAQKGGASMVQLQKASTVAQALGIMVDASMLQSRDASRLTALVQSNAESDDESDSLGAPDPAVYKNHGGSVIETLEGILDKAKEQLDDARQKEVASKHNFEMLQQSLQDEMKFGNQDLAEAKKGLAASGEAKATAEGDLSITSKDLEEDLATEGSLKHDCMTKAQDFEAAKQSRGEELKALAEAKKVLQERTGGAEVIVYGSATSFLELAQSKLSTGADLANFEAVRFVRKLAEEQHDPALTQLASRMASAIRYGAAGGDDPFVKVKGLLRDMIERLLKEGEAEATHKAYCDKELGETLEKKSDKEAAIAKLTTKIDSMTAKSAQLKDAVATLTKELADLAAAQAEMDKVRTAEHKLFVSNKAESEEGLEGVQMALKILREYYATEGKAHDAAEGASSGIVGLLEVVESDVSKALAESEATENTAASEYDRETKANAITKALKDKDVAYKSKEAKELDAAVAEATSDREGVQTELSAIMEYKGHLIQMCVAKPETYEERAARRAAEISGLKEALSILSGESTLLQRRAVNSRRHLRHALA